MYKKGHFGYRHFNAYNISRCAALALTFQNHNKMKKQFLLLIFGLAFSSVLAANEEVEYGDCPDDIAKSCLKLDKLSKCCGTKGNICCSADEYYSQFPNLEDDAKAEPRGLLRGIAKLIGFIVGAVIFVVVVCCVCCFCCPFCLFSKHRNGRVIRRNDQAQEQQNLQQVEFRFFKENNF